MTYNFRELKNQLIYKANIDNQLAWNSDIKVSTIFKNAEKFEVKKTTHNTMFSHHSDDKDYDVFRIDVVYKDKDYVFYYKVKEYENILREKKLKKICK